MTIPADNGSFDAFTGVITPNSTGGSWSALAGTEWGAYTQWTGSPVSPHYFTTPNILALPQPAWVNIRIVCEAVGLKTYKVHSSLTGAFAGEETTVDIGYGDTNIPAHYGQYFKVTAAVEYDAGAGLNTISSLDFTADNTTFEIVLSDVNSDNLEGDISAKELVLPRAVSRIQTMTITPFVPEPYFAENYVDDGYIAPLAPAYPAIYSKDASNPRVAFVSDTGVYRGSVFDVVLKVFPEQYYTDDGNVDFR